MGNLLHPGRSVGGPYTPEHDQGPLVPRSVSTLVAVLALAGSLVTSIVGYAVAQARVDAKLDTKVDAVTYERDQRAIYELLGTMSGDIRVIRCVVSKGPESCK